MMIPRFAASQLRGLTSRALMYKLSGTRKHGFTEVTRRAARNMLVRARMCSCVMMMNDDTYIFCLYLETRGIHVFYRTHAWTPLRCFVE